MIATPNGISYNTAPTTGDSSRPLHAKISHRIISCTRYGTLCFCATGCSNFSMKIIFSIPESVWCIALAVSVVEVVIHSSADVVALMFHLAQLVRCLRQLLEGSKMPTDRHANNDHFSLINHVSEGSKMPTNRHANNDHVSLINHVSTGSLL